MTTDTREFYLLDTSHKPKARQRHVDEDEDHDEGPPVVSHGAPLMVWWGPNGCGYGNSLVLPFVGKYTAADIQRRQTSSASPTSSAPCMSWPSTMPPSRSIGGHRRRTVARCSLSVAPIPAPASQEEDGDA